jgi:glycine betaine transporter
MFSTVAVAVDFVPAGNEGDPTTLRRIELGPGRFAYISVATEDALRLAVRLAAGGRVRLVHATVPLMHIMGPADAYFPAEAAVEFQRLALEQATTILERLRDLYCAGVEVDIHIAPGPPARVILNDARNGPIDAIVLGVSGHRRLYRAFLGSTADKVIRGAHCPVFVMPQPVVED